MLTQDAFTIGDSLAYVRITDVPENIRATHNK
jgi:hypothetical protein